MLVKAKNLQRFLTHLILMLCISIAASASAYAVVSHCQPSWPAWESFKNNLISHDGRVIDYSSEANKTTSEGQAYALFFALVANDRTTFDKLLNWTENNLAPDGFSARLPAWAWGRNSDGNWQILDDNSASDADLWMAYTLGEAGRLWNDRGYLALSSLLANRILQDETFEASRLGRVLLPGIQGFVLDENRLRLNPSYLPMQLLKWFATHGEDPRWDALYNSSRKIILDGSPRGYAPEWVIYDQQRGRVLHDDAESDNTGSYNAIRVYMWAGMMHGDDPTRLALLEKLLPMGRYIRNHGAPPESIHILTGEASGTGSSGFSAAMLPFLQAAGLNKVAEQQLRRIIESSPVAVNSYYDQVLSLFALGWREKLYRFNSTGNITPVWKSTCQ